MSLSKFQKSVQSKYPNAYCEFDEENNAFIVVPEMGENYRPAEEYLFPLTESVETAWKYAADSLKITQHFNRTHPERMQLEDLESKMVRMQKKQRKIRKDEI